MQRWSGGCCTHDCGQPAANARHTAAGDVQPTNHKAGAHTIAPLRHLDKAAGPICRGAWAAGRVFPAPLAPYHAGSRLHTEAQQQRRQAGAVMDGSSKHAAGGRPGPCTHQCVCSSNCKIRCQPSHGIVMGLAHHTTNTCHGSTYHIMRAHAPDGFVTLASATARPPARRQPSHHAPSALSAAHAAHVCCWRAVGARHLTLAACVWADAGRGREGHVRSAWWAWSGRASGSSSISALHLIVLNRQSFAIWVPVHSQGVGWAPAVKPAVQEAGCRGFQADGRLPATEAHLSPLAPLSPLLLLADAGSSRSRDRGGLQQGNADDESGRASWWRRQRRRGRPMSSQRPASCPRHSQAVLHIDSDPGGASAASRKVGGPALALRWTPAAVYSARNSGSHRQMIGSKGTPARACKPRSRQLTALGSAAAGPPMLVPTRQLRVTCLQSDGGIESSSKRRSTCACPAKRLAARLGPGTPPPTRSGSAARRTTGCRLAARPQTLAAAGTSDGAPAAAAHLGRRGQLLAGRAACTGGRGQGTPSPPAEHRGAGGQPGRCGERRAVPAGALPPSRSIANLFALPP